MSVALAVASRVIVLVIDLEQLNCTATTTNGYIVDQNYVGDCRVDLFLFLVVPRTTVFFFFLNDPAPTEISPLPLHDALRICIVERVGEHVARDRRESIDLLGEGDRDRSRRRDVEPVLHGAAHRGVEPARRGQRDGVARSEEHTSELQSQSNLVCRLLLEQKKE